jgi:hypothetical protein
MPFCCSKSENSRSSFYPLVGALTAAVLVVTVVAIVIIVSLASAGAAPAAVGTAVAVSASVGSGAGTLGFVAFMVGALFLVLVCSSAAIGILCGRQRSI